MKREKTHLKITMHVENEYLSLNEKTNINISITNTSNERIENGLFRLLINLDYIEILDEKFKICVMDFASIGSIDPRQNVTISIPITIKKIPENKKTYISSFINYHVIINDDIFDYNYESDKYELKFYDLNILKNEDFKIECFKEEYLIDEDIYCYLTLRNSGNSKLENLEIKNHIPQKTEILPSSIISNNISNLIIKADTLIIKHLEIEEIVNIKYKLNICENEIVENISICPELNYNCNNIKSVRIKSNEINIKIKENEFFNCNSFVHNVKKENISNGEILEHSIFIKNNTDTYIKNLSLIENLPLEIEFIKDSLKVNSINRVGETTDNPIKLGDIEPNEEIFIKYNTRANSEFKTVEFYSMLNYDTNRRGITQNSNLVKINIIGTIFNKENFNKTIENESISIGDVVNFSIKLFNQGNTPANKVIIKDFLPKHLKFIEESIVVNEVLKKECDIEKGILIDTIKPNEKININYKAVANGICTKEKTNAQIFYTYDGIDKILTSNSSSVETTVTGAKIGENNFIKETNTTSCQIGDLITTRLTIENTGNIDCESLKIYDSINSSLEFIEGSLRIDGKQSDDIDIFTGINISNLKVKEKFSITYQVKVIDYPRPNPIDDRATLLYTYIKDSTMKTREIYSTRNKVYINNPKLEIKDKNSINIHGNLIKYITYKDFVFFYLCFENGGNVGIENINLKIVLPEGIILNKESLKINNSSINANLEQGIKVPDLNVSQKIYVNFYAKHTYGESYELDSCLYIDYSFRDIKTNQSHRKNVKIIEKIVIAKPDIEITKFISDEEVEIDREFTKNINIKNTGNVLLEDIKVHLNESDFLSQCENTLFINGNYCKNLGEIQIKQLEPDETINIAIRYILKYIPLCESTINETVVTANYKVLEHQEPVSITRKSGLLKLDIKNYDLSIKNKLSSEILTLGEINNCMFQIVNTGNVPCENLNLFLKLPPEVEYIQDSIVVNGARIYNNRIKYGIDLERLNCNESITVGFDFRVNETPYKRNIILGASVECKYKAKEKNISKTFTSKTTDLKVESINIEIVKSVSHDYLQSGDILKVHTILQNNGTVEVYDLILKDNIENNLRFIEDSVYINGDNIKQVSPLEGIGIKELNIDESTIISYEYEYIPRISSSKITHFSEVNYSCICKKDNTLKTSSVKSNTIYIDGALSTFKQFSIEQEHTLKSYDPGIKGVVNVFSDAKIDDFYEINSIKNTSHDRVNSTGKKVIIKGYVLNRIEYITNDEENALYMLSRTEPFTVFINLPYDYSDEDLFFRAKCEDVFFKATSEKSVFVSSLISIEGSM